MAADDVGILLLSLRLAGSADVEAVRRAMSRLGGDSCGEGTAALLGRLEFAGLVEQRGGGRWRLTDDGRAEGERLLGVELDASGARGAIDDAYRRFLSLNGPLLRTCTDWQVRGASTSTLVENDHSDPQYDKAVLAQLAVIHRAVLPICDQLAAGVARFGSYRRRLNAAFRRIEAGETAALDRTPDSYHGVWFQLHEDLIATLGLDRSTEPLPDTTTPFPG
jgi:hypothetical protein